MKKQIFILSIILSIFLHSSGQHTDLGWSGSEIIPKDQFTNVSKWITGNTTGESCYVTTDSENVYFHWKFGTGNRAKWAICFQILNPPIVLSDSMIFGIDVKGSVCKSTRDISIKFEDGSNQVPYKWHGLASLNRWCERLVVLKKQLEGPMNWNDVKIITLVVSSDASANDIQSDSGTVVFRKLQMANAANWQRTNSYERLKDTSYLDTIRNQAIQGILTRQVSNGLFYTWKEDKSSWLYGHGILLKLLTIEGQWQNGFPANASAVAAEKLALFLVNHQDVKGFWPRAWNTDNGSIKVNLESDGTVWMGDFPWIITGLVNYYAKSGDSRVLASIQKARSFLYNLIDANGKFYTLKVSTNTKYEVTSAEAYAAGIQSLIELGDTVKAMTMLNYISSLTWDNVLKYWKEGTYSKRPVLFANTWMASLMYHIPDDQKAFDALSFVGKAMNTRGPGQPEGLDGIGPVATWYEGTLSYICAQGPGSQVLFDSLVKYRLDDGTIPAYNDNIGALVDIWAVNWSSLDATLWLYFAASKSSPFKIYYKAPDIPGLIQQTYISPIINIYPNPTSENFTITFTLEHTAMVNLKVHNRLGQVVATILDESLSQGKLQLTWNTEGSPSGIYFYHLTVGSQSSIGKMLVVR
jgi:hypothetical protein